MAGRATHLGYLVQSSLAAKTLSRLPREFDRNNINLLADEIANVQRHRAINLTLYSYFSFVIGVLLSAALLVLMALANGDGNTIEFA